MIIAVYQLSLQNINWAKALLTQKLKVTIVNLTINQ